MTNFIDEKISVFALITSLVLISILILPINSFAQEEIKIELAEEIGIEETISEEIAEVEDEITKNIELAEEIGIEETISEEIAEVEDEITKNIELAEEIVIEEIAVVEETAEVFAVFDVIPIEYVAIGIAIVVIVVVAIFKLRKSVVGPKEKPATRLFCGKCGGDIDPKSKFCRKCGKTLPE